MNLHDLPRRDQERYLDGVTVGIGTREAGRPGSDRDALDPFRGDAGFTHKGLRSYARGGYGDVGAPRSPD